MNILLPWQLVVASILLLTSVASSELAICDPPTDSTLFYKILKDNPPTKLSSVQYKSVSVNIYDSHITNSNNKRIYFHSPIALLKKNSGFGNTVLPKMGGGMISGKVG